MPKNTGESARDKLVGRGTELIRRHGYNATSVDDICTAAGVTKGAFFHHFESKEALAAECLRRWPESMAALHRSAEYQSIEDPVKKLLAAIDFMSDVFDNPHVHKSCLAGTAVQEVSESSPVLRDAAQECIVKAQTYFQSLLDDAIQSDACRARKQKLDAASLAEYWMGTIQGSLLLAKASRDPQVIRRNLTHFRDYISALLQTRT
jgi:TetR/AcrR family transcriptional regulator, transcriptional repressor for nem operon